MNEESEEQTIEEARAVFGEHSGKERGQALLGLVADLSLTIALLDRDAPMRNGVKNSDRLLRVLEGLRTNRKTTVGVERDIAPKVTAFFARRVRQCARDQPNLSIDSDIIG